MRDSQWKVSIDTGGTFTDCIAVHPHLRSVLRLKILSSGVLRLPIQVVSPNSVKVSWPLKATRSFLSGFSMRVQGRNYYVLAHDPVQGLITLNRKLHSIESTVADIYTGEEVPVVALRILTETGLAEPFPPCDLRLGSTRGTNALLERKGAKVALITTKGFKDVLVIGNQQRPDLFCLDIKREPPLYSSVKEITERMGHTGKVVVPIAPKELDRICKKLVSSGVESVAVALVNSYANPSHEQAVEKALAKHGIRHISLSSSLSSQIRYLPRTQTCLVNAYLQPIINSYVEGIAQKLGQQFLVMSSSGGLLPSSDFQPKDSLLSGPAGGVVGAMMKARGSGINRIITFDMGGTSTDVSLCKDRPELRFESTVGSHAILSPSIAIETIAAGGGSICSYDGYLLRVGPESAGSNPGPACYGNGGPLTITDVNLLLGRLDEANFSIPIDKNESERRLSEVLKLMKRKGRKVNREQLLDSFVTIANEKMAEAIRKVSIKKGHDSREFALLSFGGAGGQHACALAVELGIQRILVPYDAGLLSAYGIGQSPLLRISERLLLASLSSIAEDIPLMKAELHRQNIEQFKSEGFEPSSVNVVSVLLFARLKGQETALEIDLSDRTDIRKEFVKNYNRLYGTLPPDRPIEIESLRVISQYVETQPNDLAGTSNKEISAPRKTKFFSQGKWRKGPVYRWEELKLGTQLEGPALIVSNNATLFVENNWRFHLDKNNNALLELIGGKRNTARRSREADLELYINRFTSIANDMGSVLQRTSFSVNVKERLDFSCAILNANGHLIVNAPHIPVHLGSLGVCVRAVSKAINMREHDVVITNHPAFGGSHLPDITLIKPVFYKHTLVGYVANRAHHAEVGGKQPGSMPMDATRLSEEGIIIPPMHLMKGGKVDWNTIEKMFKEGPFPSRSVQENMADLAGALAALSAGEELLIQLCSNRGIEEVTNQMNAIYDLSAAYVRRLINSLPKRTLWATEILDDGTRLSVAVTRNRGLHFDFTGSGDVHKGNLNATPAIVQSVILYVLRLLINKSVPLNEGLMKHISVHIPEGLLNPPFGNGHELPAVVGGNTEISQRLTDTLLKAFGVSACSQGTMNNLIFGNSNFGFYETICGGTGAGPAFNGADAVHQHMTNTRITDVEIMEYRYPVVVDRFEIRKGSGGMGVHKGGNGVIRQLHFKESVSLNILSQHRVHGPYGMKGGDAGRRGQQYLLTKSGSRRTLKGMDSTLISAGQKLVIMTPGGGGWGTPGPKRLEKQVTTPKRRR